ncbi:hypothetical protein [Pontibacter anaerobius]|uniref:Lipocalin-like domain-containing protein n=1 Tax=Pontibacter anaerobius TaxID=2993940 RepID=A0ABT3RC76_9BACT|nr:hypothetical protein [Pontibacter anaerobius]MCX2739466.1 hypothetical protein [Pontibacter anaerobius]
MKPLYPLVALLILCALFGFTFARQQNGYSVVGSWKLVDMQIGNDKAAKAESNMENTLRQSTMRLVFEESGQFRMELDADGRGLSGGYYYDPENQILSIRYGSHVDTALVSWEGKNKMIHASKDGKTRTTMERVTD